MTRLFAIPMLLALSVTCQAEGLFDVRATLAFGGHLGNGTITELRVQANSSTGGTVSIKTVGGSPDVRFSFQISPGQQTSAYAPIGVDPGAPMPEVLARINASDWRPFMLPTAEASSLYFVAGRQVIDELSGAFDIVALNGSDLPRLPQAYTNISALAIDGETLASLDDAQLRSLLGFAGSCGRLLLFDIPVTAQQVFTRRAACGGNYLRVAVAVSDVESDFRALTAMTAPAMPSTFQIQQLRRSSFGSSPDLSSAGVFLLIYVIALLLLATQSRNPAAVIGLAVTASMLSLFVWPAASSREFVAWAEAEFEDDVASYRGLEQHVASRRQSYLLPDSRFERQRESIDGTDYRIHWSADEHAAMLAWEAAPFAVLRRNYIGSFPIDPSLHASSVLDVVAVCNRGQQESRSAYLQWDGFIYEIPPLVPGGTWTNKDAPAITIDAEMPGELALFRRRSATKQLSMLTVLPLADESGRAWLMRYTDAATGAATCAA